MFFVEKSYKKYDLIVNVVYSFVKIVSYYFLGHLYFSWNWYKWTFLKISITTTNKFCFALVFDIAHPLPNALVHIAINIFSIYCTPKSKKV